MSSQSLIDADSDRRWIEQHAVRKKNPEKWKSFEKYAINSSFKPSLLVQGLVLTSRIEKQN